MNCLYGWFTQNFNAKHCAGTYAVSRLHPKPFPGSHLLLTHIFLQINIRFCFYYTFFVFLFIIRNFFSMSKLPAKQIAILSAAKDLFWKHGFRRVSIEEVCAKGKVSKMTFYKYYTNKTELAKAVFEREANTGMLRFREILHGNSTPAVKIDKLLRIKLEGNKDISQEFLLDFYKSTETGLKEFIEEKTRQIWKEILEDFRLAQKKGIFRKDFKPEFLLYITQQFAGMITDETILRMYPDPQEMIREMTNFFIYGIAPHGKV